MVQRLAILFGVLWLASCAVAPPLPPADSPLGGCLDLYQTLDKTVAEQGVTPSTPIRIAGFPYLRVDRFLAHYRERPLIPVELRTWLAHLAALDGTSRFIELESLPSSTATELARRFAPAGDLPAALTACSRALQNYDLNHPRRLALIRQRAAVADDYRTLHQVLGLYPLTALLVRYGVARWHDEARRLFAVPLEALPVRGRLQRFRPPGSAADTPAVSEWTRDSLGIPQVDATKLEALFDRHAPVWEIDVAGAFDRPGAPRWRADGVPAVEVGEPVTYRYVSHAPWRNRILLQLNYLIWFAERPRSGALDILGGALDGLIWRVTLDQQGQPLLYDSIHPCGCYHQFFPTTALHLRPPAAHLPEPPLLPQFAPRLPPGQRLVIRLESATHYIQRVYPAHPSGQPYGWRDYRDLYAVPAGDGQRRSLFGPRGLVSGTERRERFLLWPMGVPSPGAMRERGRHATAFVGRRHFDDADLLDLFFEPVDSAPGRIAGARSALLKQP